MRRTTPQTPPRPKGWNFPNLVVSNLVVCNFCAEAFFSCPFAFFCCISFCSFALFCALAFALFCALLRPVALFCTHFASFCVRPRLERPRLGTPERGPFSYQGVSIGGVPHIGPLAGLVVNRPSSMRRLQLILVSAPCTSFL